MWDYAAVPQAAVTDNYQTPNVTTVYDTEKLDSDIPYDVFLSGATPVVTVTNPEAATDRELVIFRDTFSSSLAPLLCGEYAKIILLDLRYMVSGLIPQFVTFDNQDVLFLYSVEIINNSAMLRWKENLKNSDMFGTERSPNCKCQHSRLLHEKWAMLAVFVIKTYEMSSVQFREKDLDLYFAEFIHKRKI